MIIIGAGMAGLLAAHMLRRHNPVVYEAQTALPDNHGALLRFRSRAVEGATHIPFRAVSVRKGVVIHGTDYAECPLSESNAYSYKVTGEIRDRSILDLSPGTRYIAPDDFLTVLARDTRIQYGVPFILQDIPLDEKVPIISTIPMPALMEIVEWPERLPFTCRPIWSARATLSDRVDVYQTLYFPQYQCPYYRASISGHTLIVEYTDQPTVGDASRDAQAVLSRFGIPPVLWDAARYPVTLVHQKLGKIIPMRDHDEEARRAFIMAMTDQFGIYSVGRFATWRQILLDDVVQDIEHVDRMIRERTRYSLLTDYTRRLATT